MPLFRPGTQRYPTAGEHCLPGRSSAWGEFHGESRPVKQWHVKSSATRQESWADPILYGAPGHTMYNHLRGPNDDNIDCRGGLPHSSRNFYWWSRLSHNVASRSKHAGGVHSLFCDGHVQFVSSSIDLAIWRGLGSRNAGEVSGEF